MSVLITTLLVVATAAGTTWIGFRCTRESRKLLDEMRREEFTKAQDETKRLAQEALDNEMLNAVAKALKVLFSEARDYSHREEELHRGLHRREPKFPREIREGFHKVLRVSELETKMSDISSRVDIIAKHRKDLISQVSDIHKVIAQYA